MTFNARRTRNQLRITQSQAGDAVSMRDWADIPIIVFVVLLAYFWVAPVGASNAGIILCCRRSEEAVSVGLGMMPRERRDAAARVRRASRGRLRRRRGDGRPVPRYPLLDRLTPSRL